MSCKGKKGDAYKKCIKKYREDSKRSFPNFNQEKDTVVSFKSRNLNMARSVSTGRATVASLGGKSGTVSGLRKEQKTYKNRSTGNYIVKTKVKKAKN